MLQYSRTLFSDVCSKRMNMFPGFPICHTVLAHFRENIFLVLMFRQSVGTIAVLVGIVSTWHWYSRGINPVVRGISPSGSLPICTTTSTSVLLLLLLAHLHYGPGGVCVLIDVLTPMTPICFYSSSSSVSLYYHLHNNTFTNYCQASSCLKMD